MAEETPSLSVSDAQAKLAGLQSFFQGLQDLDPILATAANAVALVAEADRERQRIESQTLEAMEHLDELTKQIEAQETTLERVVGQVEQERTLLLELNDTLARSQKALADLTAELDKVEQQRSQQDLQRRRAEEEAWRQDFNARKSAAEGELRQMEQRLAAVSQALGVATQGVEAARG